MNKHRSCAETSAEIISCGVQPENGRVRAQVPHSLISAELTSTIPRVSRSLCHRWRTHLAHVAPPAWRRGSSYQALGHGATGAPDFGVAPQLPTAELNVYWGGDSAGAL